MPKTKPLMTPEQQQQFKKAVDQGLIEPIKHADYCKITPEEAEKILADIAGKMPAEAPEKTPEAPERSPERKPPVIKDPDAPATRFQKRAISEAVKAGDMEEIPRERWDALTKGEASKIISELHAKMPPAPATESQMREIDRLVKDGRIYPMKTETYNNLSKDKASTQIGIGRMNEEKNIRVEGYDPNYVSKRNQPMTDEQKDLLRKLVADKRLNPVSREKWGTLTQGEAGKLIFIGQQREAAGSLAPEFEPTREKAPEKTADAPQKAARKPASRADDMPM